MRQGEHQMEIRDRQQHRLLALQPRQRRRTLALGTMPVAAGVGHEMFLPALRAPIPMTSQGRGATGGQRAEDLAVSRADFEQSSLQHAPQHPPQGRDGRRVHGWASTELRSNNSNGPAICASRSCRTCRYPVVVDKLACPSNRCNTVISTPASSKCVAKECRKA